MIKFTEIKKFRDGSAQYSYNYDDEFIKFYKAKTGKAKLENKEVSEFIIKYLTELAGVEAEKPKRTRKKKAK
jgi:hypothetical protein